MNERRFSQIPFLRIRLAKVEPEHSVVLRISVALTITLSILALVREELWPSWWPWVVTLTWVGFAVSWLRREKRNWWIRGLLAVAMLVVGIQGVSDILNAPYDSRVALANLLMELQVIHSFDMPSRKDLNYSVLVSLVLMALASVLSNDFVFGFFFLIYLLCVVLSLFLASYREGEDHQGIKSRGAFKLPLKNFLKPMGAFLIAIIGVTIILFLFVPRMHGFVLRVVPFSRRLAFPEFHFFHGNVANPGYPLSSGAGSASVRRKFLRFNPNAYFGFNPYLDLSQRGELSSRVVLKVKTQEPGYWRGLAFDHYMGEGWTISEQPPELVTLYDNTVSLHPFEMPGIRYRQIAQTFTVTDRLPNLVFSMYQPSNIYFPSPNLYRDSDEAFRIPFYLEPGTVYTVISQVAQNAPEVLRRSSWSYPKAIRSRYLELPPETPPRLRELALDITKRAVTPYAKVENIIGWLHRYPYSLDIPPVPPGRDAVDHFVFDLKKGYCEQFASALAVLGREVRLPTRLVTGYATGTFNPFTLNYEVRERDAHAWVEVYFSNAGWVAFDASPSFPELPSAFEKKNTFIGFTAVAAYLKSLLESHSSWAWMSAFRIPASKASISGSVARFLVFTLGVLGVLWVSVVALKRWRDRSDSAGRKEALRSLRAEARTRALYRKLERKLARHGFIRRLWETPLEFAQRLPQGDLQEKVKQFTLHYVRARFSSRSPKEEFLSGAEAMLGSIAF